MFCILWQKEAAVGGGQLKRTFLKISQSSQENTSAGVSFLIKMLAALKKRLRYRCFLWTLLNFWEHFFEEHLGMADFGQNTNMIISKWNE